MTGLRLLLTLTGMLGATAVFAQAARDPHVGYCYPAGGKQGTTVRVTIGGQNLFGPRQLLVSGEGVQATVVEHVRPLTKKQLGEVGMHLRVLMRQRWAEALGRPEMARQGAKDEKLEPLPDHPLLRNLDRKSLAELEELRDLLFDPKKQPNPQIDEQVIADLRFAANAPLGDRELRVSAAMGLSNPLTIQVGNLPERLEQEPNGLDPLPAQVQLPVLDLPVVLNGQIKPGDLDRFRFRATKGQKLVIRAQARALMPYLADAVPGWFQAVLQLFDSQGRELAYDDDYRFDPDPVLFYSVPADGEYQVAIHDSIYRGREDFVYRLSVGELPFITGLFPLGAPLGGDTAVALEGWNLPVKTLKLDASPGPEDLRETCLTTDRGLSNTVAYDVSSLPETTEAEPNDSAAKAQTVTLPQIVNGHIGRPGDQDYFRFTGRAGDVVVAEVIARRVGSPLDSLLRLTGASGKVIAWNDDHVDKGVGWLTHQADSYLTAKLPANGTYFVQVSDSQNQGGEAYGYRLRLSAPRPSCEVRLTPSELVIPAGRAMPLTAYVLRRDGYSGPVEVGLKGAPAGVSLQGGIVPAGRDQVRLTLMAGTGAGADPFAVQFEARAHVGDQTLTVPAVPAEDMMQAFAYRQLVPARQLLVAVRGMVRNLPTITLVDDVPVRLPLGGSAQVRLNAPMARYVENLQLGLDGAPPGIVLGETKVDGGLVTLTLKASADGVKVGYADNLIIQLKADVPVQGQAAGGNRAARRTMPLGYLPAIPIEVVKG